MNGKIGAHILAAFLALGTALPLAAQTTPEQAKADGKAFARGKVGEVQGAATTPPDATRLTNYGGTPAETDLYSDPDRIGAAAGSEAASHQGYQAMRQSLRQRQAYSREEIDAAIARSGAINEEPLSYTSGMSVSGGPGECVPLPQSVASPGTYQSTCNYGFKLEDWPEQCRIELRHTSSTLYDYHYECTASGSDTHPACSAIPPSLCASTGSHPGPCAETGTDADGNEVCVTPGEDIEEMTCSARLPGLEPVSTTSRTIVETWRDERSCNTLEANEMCFAQGETCIDASPQTRMIDGVAVTRACWAWRRDYTCYRYVPWQDCDALEASPGCAVTSEQCITEETPCRTFERVYTCPLPEEEDGKQQYICDGNISCIDGSCETIQRVPNDEFKDAVVALNALGQADKEFDPATLRLFTGERETCSSKVFGVLNCCRGKGFPLIPGISLLVALGCKAEEILLHERDAQGLCAYVGTYCSDKFLGVCLTKKKVYCCFESKLTRILQEQGRRQLNKPWDKPKREQCLGFTAYEFAQLDLSLMDFSEVYAEFTEAARLPDELETSVLIQQKIEDYYAREGQ